MSYYCNPISKTRTVSFPTSHKGGFVQPPTSAKTHGPFVTYVYEWTKTTIMIDQLWVYFIFAIHFQFIHFNGYIVHLLPYVVVDLIGINKRCMTQRQHHASLYTGLHALLTADAGLLS